MLSMALYTTLSALVSSVIVTNAFMARKQFYPTVIYLATSKTNVMVLCNMALCVMVLVWKVVKFVFFGALRHAEVERLSERARNAVFTTCLMVTMFREDIGLEFGANFSLLLFVKSFHWLTRDRINFIEQTPTASRWTHVRIAVLLGLLLLVDSTMILRSLLSLVTSGPSLAILFVFEYSLNTVMLFQTFSQYCFYAVDSRSGGTWENKGLYAFYTKLICHLIRLVLYVAFFLVTQTYYGIPIHLIQDLLSAFSSFRQVVKEFIRYRQLTANMSERFADATVEELENDNICIICRENMLLSQHPKKLSCGHIFHVHCLRSWLEGHDECPTCRGSIVTVDAAAAGAAAARQGAPAAVPAAAAPAAARAPAAAAAAAPPVVPPAVPRAVPPAVPRAVPPGAAAAAAAPPQPSPAAAAAGFAAAIAPAAAEPAVAAAAAAATTPRTADAMREREALMAMQAQMQADSQMQAQMQAFAAATAESIRPAGMPPAAGAAPPAAAAAAAGMGAFGGSPYSSPPPGFGFPPMPDAASMQGMQQGMQPPWAASAAGTPPAGYPGGPPPQGMYPPMPQHIMPQMSPWGMPGNPYSPGSPFGAAPGMSPPGMGSPYGGAVDYGAVQQQQALATQVLQQQMTVLQDQLSRLQQLSPQLSPGGGGGSTLTAPSAQAEVGGAAIHGAERRGGEAKQGQEQEQGLGRSSTEPSAQELRRRRAAKFDSSA